MEEQANDGAAAHAVAVASATARDRAQAIGNLETPPPAVGGADAIVAARELFGLSVETARRLPGERDCNFLLTAADGRRFVMKVVHPAEDDAVSVLQARLLDHLEAKGVPAQSVVAPLGGRDPILTLHDPPEVRCRVRCVTYLAGRPLAETEPSRARWHELGGFIARLDVALTDFQEPVTDRPFLWDIKDADQLRPLTRHIADPRRRRRVAAILDEFADVVRPRLVTLPSQMIHNDANPQNVLVAPDDATGITGLIDFGDAVHGPRVQELAVAIAYQPLAEPWPFCAAIDIARGYHTAAPLTDDELALVPALVATRLALTTVITSWRSALHPENAAYIIRNDATIDANLMRVGELCTASGAERFVGAVNGTARLESWSA